jgi:hypothetical protein
MSESEIFQPEVRSVSNTLFEEAVLTKHSVAFLETCYVKHSG